MDAKGEAERQVRRYLFKDTRKQTPRLAKHLYKVPKWAKEVFPSVGNTQDFIRRFCVRQDRHVQCGEREKVC